MESRGKFNFSVGELIDVLKKFPSDMPVLVTGYESGYENFFQPRVVGLVCKEENMYWDGEFQMVEEGGSVEFEGVVLDRVVRDD